MCALVRVRTPARRTSPALKYVQPACLHSNSIKKRSRFSLVSRETERAAYCCPIRPEEPMRPSHVAASFERGSLLILSRECTFCTRIFAFRCRCRCRRRNYRASRRIANQLSSFTYATQKPANRSLFRKIFVSPFYLHLTSVSFWEL